MDDVFFSPEKHGTWDMNYHLRQVCCIFTQQVVWYNGKHYMNSVDFAKHARNTK